VLHSYTGRYIERKPMLRSYKTVIFNINGCYKAMGVGILVLPEVKQLEDYRGRYLWCCKMLNI